MLKKHFSAKEKNKVKNTNQSIQYKMTATDIQKTSWVMQELVTIIIPSFNPNELLFETLDCIKNQTYRNIEVVLVDDGSSNPDSLKTIDKTLKLYPQINFQRHQQNKGLPAARNTGIKASSGAFIFFLDGDDLIDPTSIEKHYITLKNNPSFDFVNSYVIGFGTQVYEWRGGFHEGELFLRENRNTSCFMTRKSLFEEVTFDETLKHGCEDWDFWLNVASKGLWGYTIPEFLFYYRRSDNAGRWEVLSSVETIEKFAAGLRAKYQQKLEIKGFPVKAFEPFGFNKPQLKSDIILAPKQKVTNRLLFVFPWLEIGGADKFNLDLLKGLKEKGWELTIMCTLKSEHPWLKEFQKITKDIFLLPNYSSPHNYHETVEQLIAVRDISLIFISNSLFGYYLIPFLKKRFAHIPIVDCIHCEDKNWLNGGYPRISNTYSDLIDKTYVSTGHLKNFIGQLNDRNNQSAPVEVCYTNIDISLVKKNHQKRKEIRDSWGITEDFTVILYSARMVDGKQPLIMAETIKNLLQYTDNFVCIVLGDGPLLPALKRYISENKIENKIWCMGAVSHSQHLEYMDVADIFFLPSKNEGIAITLYESMAKEVVFVGAKTGGQGELIDSTCGYLIKPETVTEVQDYTRVLLGLIGNIQKREELKLAARSKIAASFDINHMYDQMHDSLMAVCKSYQPKQHFVQEAHYIFMLNQFMNEDAKSNLLWRDILYLKSLQSSSNNSTMNEQKELDDKQVPTSVIEQLNWTIQEHMKLKEWYDEQYEVLPLWYKRVGHIIKVFKGKRKITSLLK